MLNCKYLTSERFHFGLLIFLGTLAVYSQRLFFGISLICMDEQKPNMTFLKDTTSTGRIQGVFYLGYALSQIPSSLAFINFGTRYPIFIAITSLAILNLLLPMIVHLGFYSMIVYRFLIGVLCATFLPGFFEILPNWTPRSEYNTMVVFEVTGINLANILAPLLASALCDAGWALSYYFFGGVGLIYSGLWFIGVYDKPSDHPRIKKEELEYLNESVGHFNSTKANSRSFLKIPTLKLLKCLPLWSFLFTEIAYDWLMFLLQTNVSFYFKMLKYELKDNARTTSLMNTALMLGHFSMTMLCNFLIKRKITTQTNARKIMNFIGCAVPISCLLFLCFVTEETKFWTVLGILCILHFFITGLYLGAFMAAVECVPTYSSVSFSFINSVSSVIGYFSSEVYGKLTENDPENGWPKCFLITAGIFAFAMIFHLVFGNSSLVTWELEKYEINEIPIPYEDNASTKDGTQLEEKEALDFL